jgi:glycosyltransferase involved in cell wall biosynthesis
MKKRVILHLMNGFKDASIGKIVERLVSSLGNERYGWHIGGLSEAGEMRSEYEQMGAQTVVFNQQDKFNKLPLEQIRRYLVENQVGIIHTHTIRTLLTAWLATRGCILHRRLPVIHITTKHTLTAPGDRKWGLFYASIDRLGLNLPDILVPVSQTMGDKILASPAIHRRPVVVISNAIPATEWYLPEKRQEFRKRFRIDDEAFVVGFGGRFEPVKRLDILIEAFSRLRLTHPNARLMMAGEGSLRQTLEDQASRLHISPSITWVGFCQEMPAFLSALDVYVQTSINEGLPLSILEAMAAGIPVVATGVGGVAEVITNDVDGIIIPPLSAEKLHSALLDLLNNPNKLHQLSEQARQTVQDRFSLDHMVKGYQNLYESFTA